MEEGQRVEIANGVLAGEKATVVVNPQRGEFFDRGWVWIKFDRDNAHLGREKGHAILSQQWVELERLRCI